MKGLMGDPDKIFSRCHDEISIVLPATINTNRPGLGVIILKLDLINSPAFPNTDLFYPVGFLHIFHLLQFWCYSTFVSIVATVLIITICVSQCLVNDPKSNTVQHSLVSKLCLISCFLLGERESPVSRQEDIIWLSCIRFWFLSFLNQIEKHTVLQIEGSVKFICILFSFCFEFFFFSYSK